MVPKDAPRDERVPLAQDLENGAPGGSRTSVRTSTTSVVRRIGPGSGHNGGAITTPWGTSAVVPAGIRSRVASGASPVGNGSHEIGIGITMPVGNGSHEIGIGIGITIPVGNGGHGIGIVTVLPLASLSP